MTFALITRITPRSLDAMKGYLTRAVPEIKSSHRCEALGRALGFRTYASLLHAATDKSVAEATSNARPFCSYLSEHGFEVSPEHLFRAVASGALALVHDGEPRLTAWGIGVGERKRKDDGTWESHRDRAHRLASEREALLSESSTVPFLLSLALVSRISATATIRSGTGSYKLKHIAENYTSHYPGGGPLGPVYVSNGLFIAAAIHAGFNYRVFQSKSGYDDLNVTFNMSKRSIDALDIEIRPDGALAQDRQRRQEMRQFSPLFRYFGLPGRTT